MKFPRSPQSQIQEWQQKHQLELLGCAGRSSAAVEPGYCLHHGITPGHNCPRVKNGSKSTGSCLDVLDVPQLLLHLAALSARFWITPGHDSPGFKSGSKSTVGCLDVLDLCQLL